MAKSPKDKDQEKGDEVLRHLLKTSPDRWQAKKPVKAPNKTYTKNH